MRLPTLSPQMLKMIDPDGGFFCLWSYWQPDPTAPDPEEQGQKLMMSTFLSCEPDAPCLCGSGQLFQDCCRPKPYISVICRNPGIETTYSPFRLQTAIISEVDGITVREKLNDDERLICTEDTPERGFWTYWGVPALKAPYGMICFGDIELKDNTTLEMSALSDIRMDILLEVVQAAVGEEIIPTLHRDPVYKVPKPGRKHRRKPRRK
jgi:hypothetical protein